MRFCLNLGVRYELKIAFSLLLVTCFLACYNFMFGNSSTNKGTWIVPEQCRTMLSASKLADVPQLPSEDFYVRMLVARSTPRGDQFDPQINETELRAKLKLMWTFLDLCEQRNIQVMIYGGTLLGSYRHHGVIPWDDDEDVLVDTNDKANLSEALKGNPDIRVKKDPRANGVWRVSRNSTCFHLSSFGCWPFIDVSFYKLKNGWVNDLTSRDYRYPADVTFPLNKRPYMGRWVNSPRNALGFLSFTYKPSDLCLSMHMSHKFAVNFKAPPKRIVCETLASTYPFVLRAPNCSSTCGGALETLRFQDGAPIYTVPVSEPMGVLNINYTLLLQQPDGAAMSLF